MTVMMKPPIKSGVRFNYPHISASQLKTYTTCSLQWWLSRRHKTDFVPSSLVFGSSFHCALQAFYQGRMDGRQVKADEMLDTFEGRWKAEGKPIRYGAKDDETTLLATAKRMVDAFLKHVLPSTVIGVEQPFRCDLLHAKHPRPTVDRSSAQSAEPVADHAQASNASGGTPPQPPLVGVVDLIELRVDADGVERLHLVDFKTAARKPSGAGAPDPDQLILYGIAAHRTGLLKKFRQPFTMRYDVITKTKSSELISIPVEPDRRQATRLLEKVRVIWRGMSAGIVYPQPGWQCASCPHATECERWPSVDQSQRKR